MKQVKTQDAVGLVLAHDHTQIVVDKFKGVRFAKGHIVQPEDVQALLEMGKETLYVYEIQEGMLHEDEAAGRLRDLCMGSNLYSSEPHEGKIELLSSCDGLFVVDSDALFTLNMLDQIVIPSIKNNIAVKKGDKVAAMRVVPLFIEEERIHEAEQAVRGPIFQVLPWRHLKASIFVTGSEIKKGLIKDTFSPIVVDKLSPYPVSFERIEQVGDVLVDIKNAIEDAVSSGIDLVLCTGGMSVDPDDHTPDAIRASGAEIVTYGSPVFPGAMFMLGYYPNGACVMGLPGGVVVGKETILSFVLPRVIAGQILTKRDFAAMGLGGLL